MKSIKFIFGFIFISIFISTTYYSEAQTYHFIGDTIEIELNGYKGGNIQWQFSNDKQNWIDIIGANSQKLLHRAKETGYYRTKVIGCPETFFSDITNVSVDSKFNINPIEDKYLFKNRQWQGIPSIERTPNGRLWATWYSGGTGEGIENYVLLIYSDDNGITWTKPIIVVDPPGNIRAFDSNIWYCNDEKLWFFWAESDGYYDGKAGVWAINTENFDSFVPKWSKPQRLCDGIMMNKPTLTSDSTILCPIGIWPSIHAHPKTGSNLYITRNFEQPLQYVGHLHFYGSSIVENLVVEKKDKSLLMLNRTIFGIKEATSYDQGKSWKNVKDFLKKSADSRFFLKRLQSGNLLLLYHDSPTNNLARSHLSAAISEDDGNSWPYKILIDERLGISYPDATQDEMGNIYIIYDYDRFGSKNIMFCKFNEDAIKNSKFNSNSVLPKAIIETLHK
jgi:hypothetical protein